MENTMSILPAKLSKGISTEIVIQNHTVTFTTRDEVIWNQHPEYWVVSVLLDMNDGARWEGLTLYNAQSNKYFLVSVLYDYYTASILMRPLLKRMITPNSFNYTAEWLDVPEAIRKWFQGKRFMYRQTPLQCGTCGKFIGSPGQPDKNINTTATPNGCLSCERKRLRGIRLDMLHQRISGELFNHTPYRMTSDVSFLRGIDVLHVKKGFLKTKADSKTALMFGVELECEGKRSNREVDEYIQMYMSSYAVVTSDSSLKDGYGREVVTVPATLKAHKEIIWKQFFANKPYKTLRGWHAEGAGIHIHISSDVISPLDHGKMLSFINNPKHADFIALIAGRPASYYTRRNKNAAVAHGGVYRAIHYDMLSTSAHTGKTYELRIFRSNISKRGFFKNLEFADALVQFARNTSLQDMTVPAFLKFIQQPQFSAEYRSLLDFLVLRHKIPAPRRKLVTPIIPAWFNDELLGDTSHEE